MKDNKKKTQKKVLRSEKLKPKKQEKKSEIVTMKVETKPTFVNKESRLTKMTKNKRNYH